MLRASKIWDDSFVSNGGIIERERTGKESVPSNAVGLSRMMWLFGHISRLLGRRSYRVFSRRTRPRQQASVIHDDVYGACPAHVGGCVASAYVRENVYEARLGGRRQCAHDDGVHHARADGRGLWENGSAHVHVAQSGAATLRLPSIDLRSAVAPRPRHQML